MTTRPLVFYVNLDFPPMTCAGVWRALGFVKYLPEWGYDVGVLCGDLSPAWQRYDPTLLDQLPHAHVHVWRLRGPFLGGMFERLDSWAARRPGGMSSRIAVRAKRVLQRYYPEPHVFWLWRTVFRALREAWRRKPSDVITSGPPHVCHVVGLCLKMFFGARWIADYRDLWMDDAAQRPPGGYQAALFRRLESLVLSRADAVVTVTPWLREVLEAKSRHLGSKAPVVLIANGHDIPPAHAVLPRTPPRPGPLRLFFNGTVQAGNRCYNVLEALRILKGRLGSAETPRVLFPGLDGDFHWNIRHFGLEDVVHDVGVVSHRRVLDEVREADAVLVMVRNAGPHARGVVPAKTYEAMALSQRILAVAPAGGDLHTLLADYPLAACCEDEPSAIVDALLQLDKQRRSESLRSTAWTLDPLVFQQLSRRERTRQLVGLLRELHAPEPQL